MSGAVCDAGDISANNLNDEYGQFCMQNYYKFMCTFEMEQVLGILSKNIVIVPLQSS